MSKVVFIADFFVEQILGGGELNNEELISLLASTGYHVEKINSFQVNTHFLEKHGNCFYIVSNFVNLHYDCREWLIEKGSYLIYEHDHKYLRFRNPAKYRDFKAPFHDIRNYFFYKNAKAILCQSKFHKDIVYKNLELDNITSVGGNLWTMSTLNKLKQFSKKEKQPRCSIMDSPISHKNTDKSVNFCRKNNLEYELVKDENYVKFLDKLSNNQKLVFFPGTPETLSRVVCEARMMGMSVIANELIGACHEDWFNLKGEELVDYMINKREEIVKVVAGVIDQERSVTKTPVISILTTFYEGEKFLEGFLKNIVEQSIFDKCELVLIDTASPGKEAEIVKKFTRKHKNIKYIRFEERYSPSKGTTHALRFSSGKYLNFACIDDIKSTDSLEKLLEAIEENPHVDLVYGDVYQTDKPNETFEKNSSGNIRFPHSCYNFSKEDMVKCLPGPMPLWKRTLHEKNGFFIDNEEHGAAANDWEMWLRCVNTGSKFKKIDKVVGLYLTGGRSQQENNLAQRQKEAQIFFKYSHLFGYNFNRYEAYFKQFI